MDEDREKAERIIEFFTILLKYVQLGLEAEQKSKELKLDKDWRKWNDGREGDRDTL